jgi:eukaryotic-like serine/threonine-protein kinase
MSNEVVLEISSGLHAGRTLIFNAQDAVLMGRSGKAKIRIDDDQHISRNHCLIEVQPPKCHVVDLSSANGTYVNDERVSDCWLNDGDTIRGGRTQITVRLRSADAVADTMIMPGVNENTIFTSGNLASQLQDYELLHEIGQGSMGVVYKARHLESGDIVALKALAPAINVTDSVQQVFIREAGILCQLKHKRIVRFIEAGSSNGHLYITMEYIDAIDPVETLRPLSLKNRVKVASGLMRQLLDGLAYAHDLGLVHRDIKPRNLLVSKDGDKLNARLADFGLARHFSDAGMSQVSSEHSIKGTLCFMAPEQIISSRNARPPADIFSVGATLYTLITGDTVYDLSDHHTPIATILNDGTVPLMQREPRIPQSLCKVVDKALANQEEDRFRSAKEMRDALAEVLADL